MGVVSQLYLESSNKTHYVALKYNKAYRPNAHLLYIVMPYNVSII